MADGWLYDVCWDEVGDLGQMSMAKSGEMYHWVYNKGIPQV